MPYKVDTGSDGNILSVYIYKSLFPRITNEQLVAMRNESIQLKTYNKRTITQLGTCTVEIEHNNKHKMYNFFVVLGNGQALLGMPDIDTLNIININIHSIGAEHYGGNDNCCTNMAAVQSSDMIQEQTEVRNATQGQTVFQNLTIQISQWSIINYLIQ